MADRIYLRHPVTDETVSVSTGFSWPAFLLGAIWALMKKLWLIALLMLVVELLIGVIGLSVVATNALAADPLPQLVADQAKREGKPVLVHCQSGAQRTGGTPAGTGRR